jgi:TolB-like protein
VSITPGGDTLRFERFEVDTARRQVRVRGTPVELGSRAFDVLLALARRKDLVVTKAELLDAVWPGLVVEENNLTVQVVALRKVLGADAIGTIPGRGYQLTAGSTSLMEAPPAAVATEEGQAGTAASQRPWMAVLPFTNMSDGPSQDYFADGMVDDIITALARTGVLQVIARNSSFVYKGRAVDIKQVGCELGVRYVLEGGVRKAGERIRINAQLIDASTGGHIWADRFDGALEDVFELQDRITEQVVTAVAPHVFSAEVERARRKPTNDLQAYDLLMRASPGLNNSAIAADRDQAQLLLQGALERDPRFTVVKALLAMLHMQRLADGHGDVQDVRVGLRLAGEALADHQDNPVTLGIGGLAIAVLGIRLTGVGVIGFRYDEGLVAADRALALTPYLPMLPAAAGTVHGCMGDAEAAIAHFQRARRLNPIGPGRSVYSAGIALALFLCDRYEESLASTERAILEAPGHTTAHRTRTVVLGQLGRTIEAQEAARQLLELAPRFTVSRYLSTVPLKDAKRREQVGSLLRSAGIPG